MKLTTSAALFLFAGATGVRAHSPRVHHRQVQSAAAASASVAPGVATAAGVVAGVSAPAAAVTAPTPVVLTSTAFTTGTAAPPVSLISSGMATESTLLPTATYAPGKAARISGAPALPTFVFKAADWPTMDKVPPTDSPQVQAWMKELDGWTIPDLSLTVDGTCGGSPDAAAQAQARGWWTCGGWTRDTDITVCPDKYTWGVSFDDGPGPYTQNLLNYLSEKNLSATFFAVGSRCLERPAVLLEEYMSGHEVSVHTWSHHPLTTLTTAQIVAELGWTRQIIKQVLGVTPTTMRAPFGDIDDRVRGIALAMGLVPIQWTRYNNQQFDTNDWRVAGGLVTAPEQTGIFESILGNASVMDTGFIVLQHDLYEVTVDLAMGFTLDAALSHQPAFKLQPIGQCQGWPAADLYLETTTNKTFPYANSTAGQDRGSVAQVGSGNGPMKANTSGSSTGSGNSTSGAALGAALPGLSLGFLTAGAVVAMAAAF